MDLVLQTSAEDLEGKRLPGLGVKAEHGHFLRRFDASADHAGHRQGLSRRRGDIVPLGDDGRVGTDDQLTDAGDAQRRDEAEFSGPQGRVGGDRHLQRDSPGLRRRSRGDSGRPKRQHLGAHAAALEEHAVDAVEVHLPLDGHLHTLATLHHHRHGVGDHRVGSLRSDRRSEHEQSSQGHTTHGTNPQERRKTNTFSTTKYTKYTKKDEEKKKTEQNHEEQNHKGKERLQG